MSFLSKYRNLFYNIIIAILLIIIYGFNVLSDPELRLQDAVYQKAGFVDPSIAIFCIDETALAELGRIQGWSRQIMADAINILNSDEENKPAVIAVDMLYVEDSDYEADEALAQAAKDGGNVVVASQAIFGDNDTLQTVALDYLIPYPSLAENASYGIVNGTLDKDGRIRNALLQVDYEGEALYSFPYEVYRKYTGDEENDFLEQNSQAYITYYDNPGGYTSESFANIFDEDFDPSFYADCVVFIGPYASGLMDSYYTSINSETQMYGVEIHANVLQMMLEENFKVATPDLIRWIIFLSIIAMAFAVSKFVDIRVLLGIFVVFGIGYYIFAWWLFDKGYIIMLLYPVVALAVIYLYRLIYGYVLETFEKLRVRDAFKKYVDPKLVDKLMETGEANSNEVGTLKNIAVLFVDVRGFTPMTEAMDDPEQIVKILNEYLELTSKAVFNNGGSVDKFIGDATMALFNGFVPLDDYVFKAVKSAWDIVEGAASVNASIKEKYNVDVGFGVGVSCGDAIVGNLGPSFRKDYTAIGDTVNTAARLESNAKPSEVLISAHVYEIVKDRVDAVSVGEIPLKGKSQKLEVFSVRGIR